MNTILFGALLALGTVPAPVPAEIDLRCYQAMAPLAEHPAEATRALGITAASYFLGRIDAAAPGFEIDRLTTDKAEPSSPALLRQCSSILSEVGVDLETLEPSPRSI